MSIPDIKQLKKFEIMNYIYSFTFLDIFMSLCLI